MFYKINYTLKIKPLDPKPPIPSYSCRLLTADLKVGMVVRNGKADDGCIYTVLGPPCFLPTEGWLKVLAAFPGIVPLETNISLGDFGCQPYRSGVWNTTNWLREVK